MGRGAVRADVAFITPNHIAVVEIKSDRDDTDRLLHQAGMFRAAVPELWIASLADRFGSFRRVALNSLHQFSTVSRSASLSASATL